MQNCMYSIPAFVSVWYRVVIAWLQKPFATSNAFLRPVATLKSCDDGGQHLHHQQHFEAELRPEIGL